MSGERIRSLKPEWLDDEKLAATSDTARMMSAALILLSDDHGRGRGNRLFLASRIYPYSSRDPRETLATLSGGLQELCDCGFLRLYQVSGQDYFEIINWRKHQRVDKPGKPRVPAPPESVSGDPRETLAPDLGSGSGPRSMEHAREHASPAHACDAWHAAMQEAGGIGLMHAAHAWREDFETIAAVCNGADGDRVLAVQAVCRWFWLAPDGPVRRLNLQPHRVNPGVLSKRVSSDLFAASEWLAKQEAAQ